MFAKFERRAVVAYLVGAGVLLLLAWAAQLAPPSLAPRVHVRWADGVDEPQRLQLEERHELQRAEHREGTTWTYDLADSSSTAVRALVGDPAVVDTHYIDRVHAAIEGDAPRGTTIVNRGVLSRIRDSSAPEWTAVFSACSLLLAAAWLAQTRTSTP